MHKLYNLITEGMFVYIYTGRINLLQTKDLDLKKLEKENFQSKLIDLSKNNDVIRRKLN